MQIQQLKPHIDQILPKTKWNFDLEAIDKILRIDNNEDVVLRINNLQTSHNFYCEELQ